MQNCVALKIVRCGHGHGKSSRSACYANEKCFGLVCKVVLR